MPVVTHEFIRISGNRKMVFSGKLPFCSGHNAPPVTERPAGLLPRFLKVCQTAGFMRS
jgi:hypothetical protein